MLCFDVGLSPSSSTKCQNKVYTSQTLLNTFTFKGLCAPVYNACNSMLEYMHNYTFSSKSPETPYCDFDFEEEGGGGAKILKQELAFDMTFTGAKTFILRLEAGDTLELFCDDCPDITLVTYCVSMEL